MRLPLNCLPSAFTHPPSLASGGAIAWGFRVWRGQGSRTAVELALRLVHRLPRHLTRAFRVMILADTGFGSGDFLKGVRKRRYATIIGVRCDRKLTDCRHLYDLAKSGQQVRLDQS